ncbi:MAG TPA: hypothetical protein DDY79_03815 [Brevundimonas sp.]|uniref:SIR2 family protein n=1 Tax=Brevundimonas sp. TaxID=1871086 RepID=UPI000E9644BB|nr:SIR2 family protein [Brevundimonas sp.]HBI18447.1 hypothetical protein [Brevundimonas sp.]
MPIDPVTRLAFSVFENRGVYALLLGSGVSSAAGIPTGWDITIDLIRRVGLADGAGPQTDWAAWHRQTRGEEPNYSTLLGQLAATPAERRSLLHNYIEPSAADREEGRRLPTPAHRAIAEMVQAGFIRVIITTNFDHLLETALRERGVEPIVIASEDALAGAVPLAHAGCYILKLHGDYQDARILNTEAELDAYPPAYDRLLDRILDEFGLIVCGWSGEWDPALRAAINRGPGRRYATYWVSRGAPAPAAEALIAHRDARLIAGDADEVFQGLWRRLETLRLTGAENPLDVDLRVATAKRHLSRPHERIQLDALFEEELRRLADQLAVAELLTQPSGGDIKAEIRRQTATYEAAMEPLACMTGVLGRWGDDAEQPLVLDILRRLYRESWKVRGGYTALAGLRAYPAVLAFTAYGLGLVRAGRWSALYRFLQTPLEREYDEAESVVSTLFLDAWPDGGQRDVWRSLEGMERHYTPLSDHLFAIFERWSPRFLGLTPDFARDYDRFEMLAGVVFLDRHELPTLQRSLADPQRHGEYVPVGRSSWKRESGRVKAELDGAAREDLLAAGFGRRDAEYLTAALDTVLANASDMRRWG